MKSAIKSALFKLFPRAATQVFSARARAYSQKLARDLGCTALSHKLVDRFGDRVLHGPFAGLVLSPETRREHLAPFLLGAYEGELHPTWHSILEMRFDQLIDVGAKFGYYAVGLAKRFPEGHVVAFDTDPWARKAMREMSAANDVKIEIRGFCSPEWLRAHLQPGAFIFSDCEGYETTLFEPRDIPNFSSATMLIEVHEQFSPGAAKMIREKFEGSHDITVIPTQWSSCDEFPELASFDPAEREMAVNEYRTAEQCWMFLRPKI